ncbi:MAG: sugar phosphate nucleotidyltransferase [Myxococcota bacterium]
MKALLLAAGLGTRMAPLTSDRPKPALPLLDEPLLLRLVRHLARQGIESVVVNAHRHVESLRRTLADAPLVVQLSIEPELRGSGGGVQQARELLGGSDPFLVVNADMWIELDLPALLEAHERSGAGATLVLREDPRKATFGTIGYARDGLVCRITDLVEGGGEKGSGLFTGVQLVSREIFTHMPDRLCFDLVRDVYVPWLREEAALSSWMHPRTADWWPVGTPRELLDANLVALERASRKNDGEPLVAHEARLEGDLQPPVWVGAGARVAAGARVGPHAVVGAGARVPAGCTVVRSVLLPGARPPTGSVLQRAIVFGRRVWRDA